jgi:hypothetical protein
MLGALNQGLLLLLKFKVLTRRPRKMTLGGGRRSVVPDTLLRWLEKEDDEYTNKEFKFCEREYVGTSKVKQTNLFHFFMQLLLLLLLLLRLGLDLLLLGWDVPHRRPLRLLRLLSLTNRRLLNVANAPEPS